MDILDLISEMEAGPCVTLDPEPTIAFFIWSRAMTACWDEDSPLAGSLCVYINGDWQLVCDPTDGLDKFRDDLNRVLSRREGTKAKELASQAQADFAKISDYEITLDKIARYPPNPEIYDAFSAVKTFAREALQRNSKS